MLHPTNAFRSVFFIAVILAVPAVPGAASAANPVGVWATEGGKSHVEISRCGDQLCGTIVWLKEPHDESGDPKTDANNPDETLRDRPILGLRLLNGFDVKGEGGVWRDGKIYNPEDGELYSATIKMLSGKKMEVRGYVGLPLFGKSQEWTRVR